MKRSLGILAAALGLSWIVLKTIPLPENDPFCLTLAMIPLIAALFHLISRWSRDHGLDPSSAPSMLIDLGAVSALAVLIIARGSLGLDRVDGILAAGLFLILGHRIVWLVIGLRPGLRSSLPRRPPWPFFVLPFAVYLAILPWSMTHHPPDGDEPYYLLITHSLAFDLDSELTNNYAAGDSLEFLARRIEPQLGDPVGRSGEIYSRHNLLLPIVLTPAYRLAGITGTLILMGAMSAFLTWAFLRLAYRYFPDSPGAALMAWGCIAFTPPLLIYSYLVWAEVPAAVLTVVGFEAALGLRPDEPKHRRSWISLLLVMVLLPVLKFRFLLVSAGLILLALRYCDRRVRVRVLSLVATLATLVGLVLVFNQLTFGNPLKYHDIDGLATYAKGPARYLLGLTGLFFDSAFGLFAFSPIWLALIPAIPLLIRRRSAILLDAPLVFFLYLIALIPRGEWFGGWSQPFRYLIVALPMLGIGLIPAFQKRHRWAARSILTMLAALTACLTLLWLIEPGWTVNLAHGRTHLLDHLSMRLGADTARLFPSSVRLRTASFLVPPILMLVLLVGWRLRRRLPGFARHWGISLLLLMTMLTPALALLLPTRVVEFEDPWVEKNGGWPHPAQWVVFRVGYEGSWVLAGPNHSVRVPITTGGDRLDMKLDLHCAGPPGSSATLRLRAGDRTMAQRDVTQGWKTLEFTSLDWPSGEPMVVEYVAIPSELEAPRLILNRARLRWN